VAEGRRSNMTCDDWNNLCGRVILELRILLSLLKVTVKLEAQLDRVAGVKLMIYGNTKASWVCKFRGGSAS
jgi:hypothetical protein